MESLRRLASASRRATLACAASLLLLALAAAPAPAVTITVVSTDGGAEGFNDPSPRLPVGGNPGTTLGAQRKFIYEFAAGIWAARLQGSLPVVVSASFDPLGGDAVSATLGFAAPTTVHRDFTGAPLAATWFVAGLANQYFGADLNDLAPDDCPEELVDGKCPELISQYNSDVDNQVVLGGIDFYYGIDGNSGTDVDFLATVLHEIAHGLGLLDLLDPTTGALFFGFNDAYVNRLEDAAFNPAKLAQMSSDQRAIAIRDDGDLVWNGPAVAGIAASFPGGFDGNKMEVFAPSQYIVGSSVAHPSTTLAPSELMEPFLTNPPPHDLALTQALLQDLGWNPQAVTRCGDPNNDKKINTTDALTVLKGAVGTVACPNKVCNVNFSGGITTVDALMVLKRGVGQAVAFSCPLV